MGMNLFQEFLIEYPDLKEKANEIEELLDILFVTRRLEFMCTTSSYFFCGMYVSYLSEISLDKNNDFGTLHLMAGTTGFSRNYNMTKLRQKVNRKIFYEELHEIFYRLFLLEKDDVDAIRVIKQDSTNMNVLFFFKKYKDVKSFLLQENVHYPFLVKNNRVYFTNWITGKIKPLSLKIQMQIRSLI